MQEKQASVIGRGEEVAARQEAELSRMQEVRARLEQQATSDDHIGFLQVRYTHTYSLTNTHAFYASMSFADGALQNKNL